MPSPERARHDRNGAVDKEYKFVSWLIHALFFDPKLVFPRIVFMYDATTDLHACKALVRYAGNGREGEEVWEEGRLGED